MSNFGGKSIELTKCIPFVFCITARTSVKRLTAWSEIVPKRIWLLENVTLVECLAEEILKLKSKQT